MPGQQQHHHRSGGLRQTNKKNKRTTASKRSLSRGAAGRVNNKHSGGGGGGGASRGSNIRSKADRRHQQQQKRRNERLQQKRGISNNNGQQQRPPPRVVGIVSLSSFSEDKNATTKLEERVLQSIVAGADRRVAATSSTNNSVTTCQFNQHKKGGSAAGVLTLLTPTKTNAAAASIDPVLAVLDLARVCDCLVFCVVADNDAAAAVSTDTNMMMDAKTESSSSLDNNNTRQPQDWDHSSLISERGDRILAAVKAQGLPTPVTLLVHTTTDNDSSGVSSSSSSKLQRRRRLNLKKYVHRFATTEFGNDHNKVIEIELPPVSTINTSSIRNDDAEKEEEEDNSMLLEDDDDDGKTSRARHHTNIEIVKKSSASSTAAAAMLVRTLCTMSCAPAQWVTNVPRSYVLADRCWQYHSNQELLVLTGYIRGMTPWDVNALVHVPSVGTFACQSVQRATPPLLARRVTTTMDNHKDDVDDDDVVFSKPELRESLGMFADPNALDGEQNLVGFDQDDDEAFNVGDDDHFQALERPAGWSDYQSAWLDAVDDKEGVNIALDHDQTDHGELAEELNLKKSSVSSIATTGDNDAMMDLEEANDVTAQEKRALMEQRKKQQSEEKEFPDEVQVDEDAKAAERFARYRSLKSFRKSHWDPKENLPESYASIYHFANFKQTQRSVMNGMKELVREAEAVGGKFWGKSPTKAVDSNAMMKDDDESENEDDFLEGCVPSGSYVTLTLENVPADAMDSISQNALLTAVSLLAHENKVSVLHMGLSQSSKCDSTDDGLPVKSKDVLTFRCGWRTWKARPVFSQNNLNCDKHKFERFLPTGGAFFAASVFGPVTYTPCPVLVFRENDSKHELVAVGSMIGADADRIVVKRIILTGYPVRVHKRTATVKYMFYNPEDVKWFKPAGLYTKHGLQGNIVQSVGEHGTMKCLFNAPIKQHDTVCLPLYKRIYPKFAQNDSTKTRETSSLVVR